MTSNLQGFASQHEQMTWFSSRSKPFSDEHACHALNTVALRESQAGDWFFWLTLTAHACQAVSAETTDWRPFTSEACRLHELLHHPTANPFGDRSGVQRAPPREPSRYPLLASRGLEPCCFSEVATQTERDSSKETQEEAY